MIDFYAGRGENAEWIGTLNADVDTVDLDQNYALLTPDPESPRGYTEDTYRAAVHDILLDPEFAGQSWMPDHPIEGKQAWPHGYAKSDRTELAVSYSHRAVYVSRKGHLVAIHYPNAATKAEDFPRMK